jgi:hypothetical protein
MSGKILTTEEGTLYFDQDNCLHREDGPAYEDVDGTKIWYCHGQSHREDGPAVEDVDGTKKWYWHGKFHREDGPAVECANGDKFWFYHGQQIHCQSNQEFLKLIKLKAFW